MKTMVLGASPKPSRYSHRVTLLLQAQGYQVIPVGVRPGIIGHQQIVDLKSKPLFPELHTITLYLSKNNQQFWYQYILDLKPQRVIFNPGSENPELSQLLYQARIEWEESCTLVMLSVGNYQLA